MWVRRILLNLGLLLAGALLLPLAAGAATTGLVERVDLAAKTIAVRQGRQVIGFDATNAVLRGYRSLGDIRRGDRVTVAYTSGGVRIAKGGGKGMAEAPQKTRHGGVKRLANAERGNSFDDADENNDSRVSAVELSTILPGLTMEKFREYDGDRDGSLSRREFEGVWKK